MHERKPVARVIADPETSDVVRARLERVDEILRYADRSLGLPVDGQYRTYVDVERPYVAWNVFAAPEFSTQPVRWCYPVIGCAAYRGYFHSGNAAHVALRLSANGFDTAVIGAIAYSTLGWFEDPVMSTFMTWDTPAIAALLFHELAHAKVFLRGDTPFNESFATFVEREGLREWLHDEPSLLARYERAWLEVDRFRAFVIAWRSRFDRLYATSMQPFAGRFLKSELFDAMRDCFAEHRRLMGDDRFQHYFDGAMNNASFLGLSTYNEWVPAFAGLFEESARDWTTFYEAVTHLASVDEGARQVRLNALVDEQHIAQRADDEGTDEVQCRTLLHHPGEREAPAAEHDDIRRGADGEHEGAARAHRSRHHHQARIDRCTQRGGCQDGHQ